MEPPPTRSLADRLSAARRRVIAVAAGLFVGAWMAVFAIGQHATPSRASTAAPSPATPRTTTDPSVTQPSEQAPLVTPSQSQSQDPGQSQAQATPTPSEPPLVTAQS